MSTKRARWRIITARIAIAVDFAFLLLMVAFPRIAHHAMAHGLITAISAGIGIPCGLYYLRGRR